MADSTAKLQKVVDQLLLPPFNKRLTLVSLSEILADPAQSTRLLIEVADYVKPRPLSDEEPYPKPATLDEAVLQIADYAACICYNVEGGVTIDSASFAQQLQQPSSQQLLDLLYNIFIDVSAARQKIYVSRFKAPAIVPHDVQQNDQIQELLSQLRQAQSKFTQAYEENMTVLTQQINTKIDALQTEKTQLVARQDKLIERIRQVKLQPVQEEAVQLARRRREAAEETEVLKQQVTQQNDLRRAYLQRTQAIVASAKGTPAGIIEACQNENKRIKQELINLPQEIAEKESLRELIIQDPSDEVILQMESELEEAKKDLLKLKELNNIDENQQIEGQQESQVVYLRQNLAKFKRKHAELQQKHEKLLAESQQVDAKMKSLMNTNVTIDTIDGMDEIPLIAFKDLVGKGKAMKAQMQRYTEDRTYLKKEFAVLTRTVEILTQICVINGQDVNAEVDQQQVMNTQNLHEARALLAEIETTIKNKRNYLQPKINELGNLKRQQQNLEQLLETERHKIQQLDVSKQGSIYKLKMTLQKAEAECQNVVSEIYRTERQMQMLKYEIQRAQKDKDVTQLKKEIVLEQNDIKLRLVDLREKQAKVKDNLSSMMEQKRMFRDLVSLLRAKQESIKRYSENNMDVGENIKLK